jgi:hypothetical protein
MRMRPIYETARLLAQGWHGHHPSRADHGRCRDADAFVEVFYTFTALSTAPSGTRPVMR